MRRIAGQHQPPEPHRLGNEAAKRGDALFQRRAGFQRLCHLRRQAAAEFVPEGVVRPILDLVVDIALDVIARPGHRAHRAQGKAARGVRIDDFMRHRPRIGQQAKPAERIDLFIGGDRGFRHGTAADPVIAVTAGDEVAVDPVSDSVLGIGDPGMRRVDIVNGDVGGLVDSCASRLVTHLAQVARHFGLAVGGDHLAAGVFGQADGDRFIVKGEVHGVMRDAFGRKPVTGPGPVDQINGGLLENAGTDPRQHIFLCLPLENDIVDSGKIQKTAKQQPGRACPHNHNLFTHLLPPGQLGHRTVGK